MKEEKAVELKDLKHAHRPPKVPAWWTMICWGVFIAGALLVLVTLGFLTFEPATLKDNQAFRVGFLTFLATAFGLAAANTVAAANWFNGREKDLQRWFREHSEAKTEATPGGHLMVDNVPGKGKLQAQTGDVWDSQETRGHPPPSPRDWNFISEGEYVPNPYRTAGKRARLHSNLKEYFDLIHAEVATARTRAGAMAAALGGVFVAGLQVYVKVLA